MTDFSKPTIVGNGIYVRCSICGKIVKTNKFFFGSLHVCLTDEEIRGRRSDKKKGISSRFR